MKDKEKQFKERIECGIAYCEDTPNNQIEEKDKMYILNTILQEVKPLELREKIYWGIVEFINKKLPEDSVVLSREEFEKGVIERESMRKQITELFNDREKARKETAEKFAKGVKKRTVNWSGETGFFLTYEELDELTKSV